MRRTAGFLAAVAAPLALTAGVALAASSPTVSTGPAKSVSNTAESLTGTINPNGNQTGYVFQYGLTNAYGLGSSSHSAGGGTKPVNAAATIRGLTPGTLYHYRIAALNKAGGAEGRDRTFNTSGHPPANVVTGGTLNVRKEAATVTGSVTPNGAQTTWVVQYGLTTAYGFQNFAQSVGNGNTPVPVAATLTGIAPATLFHYRIVAFHGGVTSTGADQTFFTEPIHRPKPRMGATTRPSRDRGRRTCSRPTGRCAEPALFPRPRAARAAWRCATTRAAVRSGSSSRRSARTAISRPRTASAPSTSGGAPCRLRITIHFRGNGYLAPADHTNFVTAG